MTTPSNSTRPAAPVVPGDLFARHQIIVGLRALAVFLEANPGVPVNEFGHDLIVSVRADDASAVALVDATAALLGVDVADDTGRGGHYTATRTFGRVSYRIVHIPQRRHEEYRARDSYWDNITVDTGHTTERAL
ncbi:hypothetical protein [Actinomadura madurae]|uniref:hypothetical protein n=1 Tax=Actinomadura madurae TaxID=1993 RepID=UPI0020D2126B|nr:hypothetical protein [Actinomadura madurae]MCP9952913.1 hypothetical protein [Actinomadura madurae]MCP9969676.1 hypothetical protein [Actinomadura madurae]MCP9982131.1 hypothetical protein [Actinomadura madurae]MCQ0006341.1 hypothetical protein [Actinomadura madurae]MCQ0018377.1 hypothetical protein [Actinomadura madurae]